MNIIELAKQAELKRHQEQAPGMPKQEPIKIDHKHEWFTTGEMEVGQARCISCGAWAQEEMPQRMAKRIAELEALLERQTARIVDLQTHIENFDGEDR